MGEVGGLDGHRVNSKDGYSQMKQDATESAPAIPADANTEPAIPLGAKDPISEYLDVAALGMKVLATVLDSAGLVGSDVARQWLEKHDQLATRALKLEEFVELVARSGAYGGTTAFIRDEARDLLASRSYVTWATVFRPNPREG